MDKKKLIIDRRSEHAMPAVLTCLDVECDSPPLRLQYQKPQDIARQLALPDAEPAKYGNLADSQTTTARARQRHRIRKSGGSCLYQTYSSAYCFTKNGIYTVIEKVSQPSATNRNQWALSRLSTTLTVQRMIQISSHKDQFRK